MLRKYIKESIELDIQTLGSSRLSLFSKIEIIVKKYGYLLFCSIFYVTGRSRGSIMGKVFYFPNRYGFLSLQRILIDEGFLVDLIPSGLSFLDIGAHAGEFAFFAEKMLGARRVYCVEPSQDTFRLLKLNRGRNVFHCAFGNKNSECYLYHSLLSSQLNSLVPSRGSRKNEYSGKEKVKCYSADYYVDHKIGGNTFDVIKIDVEGAEQNVLKGCQNLLKHAKYLVLEMTIIGHDVSFFGLCSYIDRHLPDYELIALSNYRSGGSSLDAVFRKK